MEPTVVFDDPEVGTDRAELQAQFEAQQVEEEARRQLAQDVQAALALLDGNATLAQMRVILARLIRYLVNTGAIGP